MIWIDLENTPHVIFFKPIIDQLTKKGYKLVITARDCFQVCEIADQMKLDYIKVGRHYGKNKILKSLGLVIRVFQLWATLRKRNIRLAVSHASRSQILLASLLKIKQIVILDYEFVKMLPFVTIDEMAVPEVIPESAFSKYTKRVSKYPGIKEDVYVPSFTPNPSLLYELGINEQEIIITVRPPATEAHYNNETSEHFFKALLDFLVTFKNVKIIMLPRNTKQELWIKTQWKNWIGRTIIIPGKALDGLNVVWHSDLVIGGGGTMNREAAALKVPVYSTFKGKIGAVDKYLQEQGFLTIVTDEKDFSTKIKIAKREKNNTADFGNSRTCDFLVKLVENRFEAK